MTVTINGNGTITPTSAVQPTGSILQVVSRFQNTGKSTTSTSFANVTDVYGSITPASSSNKILVLINGTVSISGDWALGFRLNRTISSTTIQVGGASDTQTSSGIQNTYAHGDANMMAMNYHFLDSPSTTDPITYQLTWKLNGGTGYWNSYSGSVGADYESASSVILMEVAG